MANKKNRKPAPDPVAKAPAPPATEGLWPKEFTSPRASLMIAAITGAICIAWLALGLNSALIPAKVFGAYLLGFFDPTDLGPVPTGFDLASVLAGFTLLVGGTLIHPACGLIVLATIRPWLDGYTFPSDNVYFLWGTIFIFVLWGVRALMRGDSLRSGPLAALLFAVLLFQVLSAVDSIQFAKSYRHLLLWANYFFLFLLVLNTLRSRRTIQFVLYSIAVVAGLEAAFAILQYYYIFPYLRVLLNERPDLRQHFFGIADWTPELAHRFNTNRAFGTVLFPNSFAAFVILLLPHVALQAIQNFRAPAPVADAPLAALTIRRYRALAVGIVAWFIGTCAAFAVLQMPATYAVGPLRGQPLTGWSANTSGLLVVSVIVGAAIALLLALYTDRRGLVACGRFLYRISYLAAAVALAVALFLSFSRGGMLALFVASVIGVFIYRTPESRLPARLRAVAAAAVLLMTCAVLTVHGRAGAQDAATPAPVPGQPSTEVTEAGRQADLGGTESFRLRFTYWRVAARIFADNPLNGVGLGAMEWAYPAYQRIGDGDVREAHNGYLQALAETGILGGGLLILFWSAVVLCAARAVIREEDRQERILLAGLFTGILAFLGQAFIDINFQHPSLMFYAFMITGIFFARVALRRTLSTAPRIWLLLPLLALAALAVGLSMRVYTQDLALSRMRFLAASKDQEIQHRYEVGDFFFGTVMNYALKKNPNKPSIPVRSARTLVRDTETLKLFGTFYMRDPLTSAVYRLQPGDEITDDAVIRIDNPWNAYGNARKGALKWVAELEAIDARFPHDPQLANHIANWYGMLAEGLIAQRHMQDKRECVAKQIHWSGEAIKRSPMYADLYVAAASAYWVKSAMAESAADRVDAFTKAIELVEKAPPLAQAMPQYELTAAYAYRRLANAYDKPETQEKRKQYLRLADEHQARGDAIYNKRNALGLFTPNFGGAPAEAPSTAGENS